MEERSRTSQRARSMHSFKLIVRRDAVARRYRSVEIPRHLKTACLWTRLLSFRHKCQRRTTINALPPKRVSSLAASPYDYLVVVSPYRDHHSYHVSSDNCHASNHDSADVTGRPTSHGRYHPCLRARNLRPCLRHANVQSPPPRSRSLSQPVDLRASPASQTIK